MLKKEDTGQVTLYSPAGEKLVSEKAVPELDPTFLKSFTQLHGTLSAAEQIARNPYANHSMVYKCVSAITRNIKYLVPAMSSKKNPQELIYDHPALERMKRPNPYMNRHDFFEAILLNILLPTPNSPGGQCFILPFDEQMNPVDIKRGQIPTSLWPYSDVCVKAVITGGVFQGWEFRPPVGQPIMFYPEQVIRIKLYNPTNWLLGLSPYSSLEQCIVSDAKGLELVDKFYENNANLGSYLTTDKFQNDEQLKRLIARVREQYAGYQNAGKMMVLHSGMKMEAMSKNLTDLQFLDQRKFTEDQIIGVYGCKKLILGLSNDINRSTAEVEKELFWEDTLIPYIKLMWDGGLNPDWIEFIKGDYEGRFDLTGVEALKRNTDGKVATAHKLILDGMPPNQAWKTVGLDTDTEDLPWLDEPYVPGARTNLRTGEVVGKPQAPSPEKSEAKSKQLDIHITRDEQEAWWWDYVTKTLQAPEKDYKRMLVRFWTAQRNKWLDKVDAWARGKKAPPAATLSDFLIDKKEQDKILIKDSAPVYVEGIKLQAGQMETELGELINWEFSKKKTDAIISTRTKYLRGVNSTTFKTMGNAIDKILKANKGLSIRELAKLLKTAEQETMGGVIASSSKTVARTETSSIASETRFDIMDGEGVKKHQWVAAADERTRPTHTSENGNVVEIGKKFPVTGLKYPLAPGAPASEVVNCRCTSVAVKE